MLYTEITDENGNEDEVPVRDTRQHDLSLRVTHKYVGTWQHEDQWRSIGTYEVLQSSDMCTDDEDPCEPTRTMTLIKVRLDNSDHSKPLVTDQDVKRAIKDTMTHLGCSHEHDCCGCWNTLVHHVVKCETLPDGDEWFVTKHSIRNY